MSDYSWGNTVDVPVPDLEETLRTAKEEEILFPAPEKITRDWILRSQLYRAAFSDYLIRATGLDRLDRRLAEQGFLPAFPESMSFFQKYDLLGLPFFYIRMMPRVDRLAEADQALLTEGSRDDVLDLVRKTFPLVMTVEPEQADTVFEPTETLHGDYQVHGDEIPIAMRSAAEFDSDGALLSEEREQTRVSVFTNVWRQIDNALTKDLGCRTRTAVELFFV